MIGLFAILGIFALKLVFGILPALVGMLVYFVMMALKIALFVGLVYFIIRVVSPDTARRLRSRWSGSAT
jgi:hypothetical protein